MNKITAILVGAFAGLAAALPAFAAPGAPFAVMGWPLPEMSLAAPPRSLGDDPVVGRQICPPLTRLDLGSKRSDELLVKRASYEHASSGHAVAFRYELRPGLYWWSGQAVSGQDLAAFLRREIKPLAAELAAGTWSVPDYEVRVDSPLAASVHFNQEPVFGPFLLDGAPFYRALPDGGKAPFAFECVGLYRPEEKPFGLALVPSEGYKSKGLPSVSVYKAGEKPAAMPPQYIELRYANAVASTPELRPSDKGSGCSRTIELPRMTMVVWNTKTGLMASAALRRAINPLIPRNALVAAGAAQLAEATSSPVPREHPGFHPQTAPKGFDLHAASANLNRLGFKRKTAGSPRLTTTGEPFKLTLASTGPSPNLAEKVLADAFSAVGISLEFRATSGDADHPVDGTLAAIGIDWPRVNLLPNFHHGAKPSGPFSPLSDPDLDRWLERYAVSLTTANPDFSSLQQVQKRLAELEPITVLFRQKACLEAGRGVHLPSGSLSQRDPDWFRRLLL